MPFKPKRFLVVGCIVLIPLWLLATHPAWGNRIRVGVLSGLEQPLVAVQRFKTAAFSFLQAPSLRSENKRLKQEIALLTNEPLETIELEKEAVRLRELLGLKRRLKFRTQAARVIGRDATPWFKTLLIDAGESDGLKEDAAVVNAQGLVGQCVEVGQATSRVLLVTDPRFRSAALVQRSRAQGMVLGTVRGRCYLAYITSPDAVEVGDLVLTSGVGKTIPKGLLIGKVAKVEKDPSGLYWQARLIPAVDSQHLEELLCLKEVTP